MFNMIRTPYVPLLLLGVVSAVAMMTLGETLTVVTVVGIALLLSLLWVYWQRQQEAAAKRAWNEQIAKLADADWTQTPRIETIQGYEGACSGLGRLCSRLSDRIGELEQTADLLPILDAELAQSQEALTEWSVSVAQVERMLAKRMTELEQTAELASIAVEPGSNGAGSATPGDEETLNAASDFETFAHQRLAELLEERRRLSDGSEQLHELVRIVLGVAAQSQLVSLNVATDMALEAKSSAATAMTDELGFLARNADRAAQRAHQVVDANQAHTANVSERLERFGEVTRAQIEMSRQLTQRLRESLAEVDLVRLETEESKKLSAHLFEALKGAHGATVAESRKLQEFIGFQNRLRARLAEPGGA